jgi:hypothetical protein
MSTEPTPSRRSRGELRELVVSAAIDLIRTEGLGVVSTTLTYQRVFEHLEATKGIRVTRASVHERIWDSQLGFQTDVLAAVDPWNTASPAATLDPAFDVFERTSDWPPLDRMREMTRVAADLTQVASEADPLYYSWVGMTMSLAKDPSVDFDSEAVIADSVGQANKEILSRVMDILRTLGGALGVRPKTDLFQNSEDGWLLLVMLGTSLSEGATVRTRFSADELPNVWLATGQEGELQEWTAFAVGYWALLQAFIEIDPEVHPDLVD